MGTLSVAVASSRSGSQAFKANRAAFIPSRLGRQTDCVRLERFAMHGSPLANPRIGSYANGVAFQSPGSPAVRGAPWVHNASRYSNPNGVLQSHRIDDPTSVSYASKPSPSPITSCSNNRDSPLSNPVGVIAAIGRRVPRVRGIAATLGYGI